MARYLDCDLLSFCEPPKTFDPCISSFYWASSVILEGESLLLHLEEALLRPDHSWGSTLAPQHDVYLLPLCLLHPARQPTRPPCLVELSVVAMPALTPSTVPGLASCLAASAPPHLPQTPYPNGP